jgi:hypothetical protein
MPKITELPNYDLVDISSSDVFPVVDIETDTTKKSTVGQITTYINSQHTTSITQSTSDNSTLIATDEFVHNVVNTAINGIQSIKAWANFNGVQVSGTYIQSGTVVTLTFPSNHGMSIGDVCQIDFTSGTAIDRYDFVVSSVPTTLTCTVVANNNTNTSGNFTRLVWVRSSFNISSISKQLSGYGRYIITFTNPMSNNKYVVTGSANWGFGYMQAASLYVPATADNTYINKTTSTVLINITDQDVVGDASTQTTDINVVVFGN